MKNSNDTIGSRTRDLPVCSVVPQQLRHRVIHDLTGIIAGDDFLGLCIYDIECTSVISYCHYVTV